MSALHDLRLRLHARRERYQQLLRARAGAIRQAGVSPANLQHQLNLLEVPTCDCEQVFTRVCGHRGQPGCPCERGRECECSWHCPPCAHVAAREAEVSIEDWSAILLALDPTEYDEPPPPLAPALALSQDACIDLMAQRYDVCTCGQCQRRFDDPERWQEPRRCHGLALHHVEDETGAGEDLKIGLLPLSTRTDRKSGAKREVIGLSRTGRMDRQQISTGLPEKPRAA